MRASILSFLILASVLPLCAEDFAFAPHGGFLRDGEPVYLIGNLVYGAPHAADYEPFFVNVPGWEWLYERPPSRGQFDRLAFNATGGEVSTTWLRKYRPEKSFWQGGFAIDWADVAPGYYANGLPVFVDFTCAGWSHGGLRPIEGRTPSKDAFSAGDCHFMPYSIVTEEGFALYREMWQSGARELLTHGVRPFVYELFNEPTYHDTSSAAEAEFAKLLAKLPDGVSPTVKKIARMRFDERIFARAMKRGKEALREVDPSARTCFQPLGISFGFVNPLLANATTDVVMSPTGGGDAYDALVCLAIAGDRPILDGEAYMGATRTSHRARILIEYARGFNATYYFKWGRRNRSEMIWREPNGPVKIAEQLPYECLNSAACPPEAFAGMKDAADDIAAVNELFTPRNRGVAQTVALLVSQATERLDRAERHPNATYTREAALALLAARLPVKAIFEEQLDAVHLEGVKLIVAAGVDATLRETNKRLLEWVEAGGVLLTVVNTLNLTECGMPAGNAFVTGRSEPLGKGRLVHFTQRPSSVAAPGEYRRIAETCGIRPTCAVADARTGEELPGVECAAAQTGTAAGFILINNDLTPRAVRVRPVSVGAKTAGTWIDVRRKSAVARTEEGDLLVRLPPGDPVVLRTVAQGSQSVRFQKAESAEGFFAGLADWFAANRTEVSTDAFWVNPSTVECVDLRRAANGALEGLFGQMPWGRRVCQGIPFEFVRVDQNDGRSGVFLDGGSVTVDARGEVSAFDVLFAAPEGAKGALFDVRLALEDGTEEAFSFSAPDDTRIEGWRNLAGKGLWLARRTLPRSAVPRKVKSLRISSRQKGIAVAAVSMERPEANPFVAAFAAESVKVSQWGGVKLEVGDDRITMGADDGTLEWSCLSGTCATPVALTADDIASRSLVFEVNQGETATGPAMQSAKLPQVMLFYTKQDASPGHGPYVANYSNQLDADASTWQEIRIPLRRLVPTDATAVTGFGAQFRPFGSQRAGVIFRALRIE